MSHIPMGQPLPSRQAQGDGDFSARFALAVFRSFRIPRDQRLILGPRCSQRQVQRNQREEPRQESQAGPQYGLWP